MSDGMGREPAYLSSHATNRYFIPNWGSVVVQTPRVLVAVGRAVLVKLSRVAEEIVVAAEVDEIEAAWCDLGIDAAIFVL